MAARQGLSKIIVAYDGSKDSAKAVRAAATIAKRAGANVVIVHAFLSPVIGFTGVAGMPAPAYTELEDAKKESSKKTLAKGVELASELGVKAKGELIETSSVVQALVEYAAAEKADLIVAGTRGMTGFKKLLLGSVSSGLVNHAPCDVLIVR